MQVSSKKAFTMIELVFVIVVIGILSAIAIPKFAATRDDAIITKAITTVGSVRSAIAIERQKRILRGDFTAIGDLGDNTYPFRYFDDNSSFPVLEYPVRKCAGAARGCWTRNGGNQRYFFRLPHNTTNVRFDLENNRFECKSTAANCIILGD